MSNQDKPKNEQPFFAQFLEDQDVAEAQGGAETTMTLKYPSDRDEINQTMKYPSDGDEGGYDLP
jgi:hypothetical protein